MKLVPNQRKKLVFHSFYSRQSVLLEATINMRDEQLRADFNGLFTSKLVACWLQMLIESFDLCVAEALCILCVDNDSRGRFYQLLTG